MTTVLDSRAAIGSRGDDPQANGRGELQRALRASVSETLEVRRRGHGVHGMVLAIRDALARGDDSNDLLGKIDGALDAASKHLAEQGFSQDEIDAAVARFRERLAREIDALASSAPKANDAAMAGAAKSVAVAEAAREVKRERFSLDILTAEGDEVAIRFKSLSVTELAAARVPNGSGTATAVEAGVISRGRFIVEVDGDLNEAERAAIGDLLDEVDGIARDFFGGDVQAAFAAASRVGLGSDALSAFSLRLSYSRSTAVAAYAKTAALANGAAAAQAAAPAKSATPSKVADVATTAPIVDSTAATPSGVAANTPAGDAPSARQTIASFTKDVLARLSTAGENGAAKFSLRWKVEFLMTALESVAATPAQQGATNALGHVLDSSAA